MLTMTLILALFCQDGSSVWDGDAVASWYGEPFHGRLTACGEVYDMYAVSVAHKSLPMGTIVEFQYEGRRLTTIVNDRGPYVEGRDFDLSRAAFDSLTGGHLERGLIRLPFRIIGRKIRSTMRYNLGETSCQNVTRSEECQTQRP